MEWKIDINSRKYSLILEILPFRIEKQFGLQLKPHEDNIVLNISGNQIFSYDSSIKNKKSVVGDTSIKR